MSTPTMVYLEHLGVSSLSPRTAPFDPGYDPATLDGHLEQSGHLMSILKLSMACWMIANETVSRRKLAAARNHGVPTVAGGGPFEIAVVHGRLPDYLDLCADMGFTRIEAGQGFTETTLDARKVIAMAQERGLDVQFELGAKHGGAFTPATVDGLIEQGRHWLEAGAVELVIEARESARGVGLFDGDGRFDTRLAERFAEELGLERVVFEAPTKASQFTLLDHFGSSVRLCNIRLEELLRVEIYRRGLHSDAFSKEHLRPQPPATNLDLSPRPTKAPWATRS
jgi:phosphosulfolactate synthase